MQIAPTDISALRDYGVLGLSLIILGYAKWMADRSYSQVEKANDQVIESQKEFRIFVETSYKENTKTIAELIDTFKRHVETEDKALELLKEQQSFLLDERNRLIDDKERMITEKRMQVPKEYRKNY